MGGYMLERKDWVLLFVPIVFNAVFNGILVTVFKQSLELKSKIKDERRILKRKGFSEFLDSLESMNSSIIDTIVVCHNQDISVELANINSYQIELNKCYSNKASHLESVSKQYDKFSKSWELFAKQAGLYSGSIKNNELDWAICYKNRTLHALLNLKMSVELLIEEVNKYN